MTKDNGMFGISAEEANSIANWVYLIGGGLAVFFTATTVCASWVMWKTSAAISDEKDRQLVRFQTESTVRAAALEQEAAKANARAAESQLELERLKRPRTLTIFQQTDIAARIAAFKSMRFDAAVITGDPEAIEILGRVVDMLKLAGWEWIEWNHPGGPLMNVFSWPNLPNVGQIASSSGIDIMIHPEKQSEFGDAANALASALDSAGLRAKFSASEKADIPNKDTVHVLIGKKPL